MQYFITSCGPLRSEETQRVSSMHFIFIFLSCFLVKDQEEIGDFGEIENQEECRYYGDIMVNIMVYSKENKHFTETVSFKEVDNVERTMSTQSGVQKFEVQAKMYEQAALDARHKAAEATEKKGKRLVKKEDRDKKKRLEVKKSVKRRI